MVWQLVVMLCFHFDWLFLFEWLLCQAFHGSAVIATFSGQHNGSTQHTNFKWSVHLWPRAMCPSQTHNQIALWHGAIFKLGIRLCNAVCNISDDLRMPTRNLLQIYSLQISYFFHSESFIFHLGLSTQPIDSGTLIKIFQKYSTFSKRCKEEEGGEGQSLWKMCGVWWNTTLCGHKQTNKQTKTKTKKQKKNNAGTIPGHFLLTKFWQLMQHPFLS